MLQNREHEKVDKKGNGKSNSFEWTIEQLKRQGNYRVLPLIDHQDKWIKQDGHCMLNLSSNDYLGLASDISLRNRFMCNLPERDFLFSSSSSRLLTGNYPAYTELEQEGFVKNVQGRGCFVLGSGSELMKEQLIRKVENGLTEAIKAAKIANLSNEELHHLLDILLEANTDD